MPYIPRNSRLTFVGFYYKGEAGGDKSVMKICSIPQNSPTKDQQLMFGEFLSNPLGDTIGTFTPKWEPFEAGQRYKMGFQKWWKAIRWWWWWWWWWWWRWRWGWWWWWWWWWCWSWWWFQSNTLFFLNSKHGSQPSLYPAKPLCIERLKPPISWCGVIMMWSTTSTQWTIGFPVKPQRIGGDERKTCFLWVQRSSGSKKNIEKLCWRSCFCVIVFFKVYIP